MVKMKDMRRTPQDVKEDKKALGKDSEHAYVPPEDDGARFEMEHHHLEKLGVGGGLKSGDTVHFHGMGTVEKSESKSSPDGDRHSATVRFHKGAVEHEKKDRDGDAREDLRQDIKNAAADKKIPEKEGYY